MKLVWSPEMASKAYIDTVKFCKISRESGEPELISAMAGGWNPKLMVEAWWSGGAIATSVGLAIAARHAGALHVCMVPNEGLRLEYVRAMRGGGLPLSLVPKVVVGEAEEVMAELPGVDFLVVDGRRKDFRNVIRVARLSHRGAVLLCKNARYMDRFRWDTVLGKDTRVERSVVLPVGQVLNIAYVAKNGGAVQPTTKDNSRWITKIDRKSGEEHIFRPKTIRSTNVEWKKISSTRVE